MKTLKRIGTVLQLSRSSLASVRMVRVSNGAATLNNLDTIVTCRDPALQGDYLADYTTFASTLDLTAAHSSISVDDFPGTPVPAAVVSLPVNLLRQNLASYLPYCATGVSRGVLQCVAITTSGTVAINGHVLQWDNAPAACLPVDLRIADREPIEALCIRPETINVLKAVGEPVQSAAVVAVSGISALYLQIETERYTVLSKLYDDYEYVAYQKVVPATSPINIDLSAEQVATLAATVKMLQPYSNDKTRLLRISGNRIRTYGAGRSSPVCCTLPFPVFPEEERGINVDYLGVILAAGEPVRITYQKSNLQAIVLRSGTVTRLIMPLRIEDDMEWSRARNGGATEEEQQAAVDEVRAEIEALPWRRLDVPAVKPVRTAATVKSSGYWIIGTAEAFMVSNEPIDGSREITAAEWRVLSRLLK